MKQKIKSGSQYHSNLAKIERFIEKGFEHLNKAETAELKILSEAVEVYEKTKFPMPMYTSIADILADHMQEHHLTQLALSKKLGIANSAISDIIHGKKKPNLAIVIKLHQKLNIDGNLLLRISA